MEITAYGEFSPTLRSALSDKALRFLEIEKIKPDIVGFVRKKLKSQKELITVEAMRNHIQPFLYFESKFLSRLFWCEMEFAHFAKRNCLT